MSQGLVPKNPPGNPYRTLRLPLVLLACAIASLAAPASVKADLIIDIVQSGSDVVATATGTLDLAGLSGPTADSAAATIIPGEAAILVGGPGVTSFEYFAGISGPSAWGGSGYDPTSASSGAGSPVGLEGVTGDLFVPSGYISGSSISGTATWSNASFSSLGLTPGTYSYSWGSVVDGLTVQVGPSATVVPEPATLWIAAVGSVAFITYGGFARSKKHRRDALQGPSGAAE